MSLYFYFAAGLPMLRYAEPPRTSSAVFLATAKRLISKADAAALEAARLDNLDTKKTIHPLFSRFQEWEINLRNRLASLRASARKADGAAYERRARTVVETARPARNAFEAANPLLAEDVLNKARWDFLSGLEGLHRFDFGFFLLYSLKLQVLERKVLLEQERGRTRHEALEAELDGELKGKMSGAAAR